MAAVTPPLADGTNRQDFVFIANEENDFFSIPRTDKHYTQGIHFSLLWPDDEVPWPARPLAWTQPLGIQQAIRKFGFEAGQDLYTPINPGTSALVTNDRPYAGWLFVGGLREDRGLTANQIPTLDRYEVELGIVGPWALGGNAQNWWQRRKAYRPSEERVHRPRNVSTTPALTSPRRSKSPVCARPLNVAMPSYVDRLTGLVRSRRHAPSPYNACRRTK